MRDDALGLFWQDVQVVKQKKEVIKRTPPERTWESPDYLPYLGEALEFNIPVFTDDELIRAAYVNRESLIWDCEIYQNYFLAAFKSLQSGKFIFIEMTDKTTLDINKLGWILENFHIVGFNSLSFDQPIATLALTGSDTADLKLVTNQIIVEQMRGNDILRMRRIKQLKLNHTDLIEVAPLHGSLKQYGGRIHTKRLQDLPFHPETVLSEEQIAIVRWYCANDLQTTEDVHGSLLKDLQLRDKMSSRYKFDLRSKSDAQIAEVVIGQQLQELNGKRPQKPVIEEGTAYKYNIPPFIKFQTPFMQAVLDVIREADFVVAWHGAVEMPREVAALKLRIGDATYQMGIGGLHSTEKTQSFVEDERYILRDYDVVSYYPRIILNQFLYPEHLGPAFLRIYQGIVDERVAAKRAGDKATADSLKITVNGSFGKLGSKYSILYAPDLLTQVTISGQLSLLMLIETLELAGIKVVSANTDGLVIHCHRALQTHMEAIIKWWEDVCDYETEVANYRAIYSKDVNNYIAVKHDGTTKTKGRYADGGLHKNPEAEVSVHAVKQLLTKGIPVATTISECKDFTMFVTCRQVKGGAVKDGEFLGKIIRWYYSTEVKGEIVYANTGNKVPRSDNARPAMTLPTEFPGDIDFDWYITEAERILVDIGYTKQML